MHARPLYLAAVLLASVAASTCADAKPVKSPPKSSAPSGDAVAGGQIFKTTCSVCHGQQAEGTALAPPLRGVVGAKAATSPFPRYTPALKASGLVWSAAKLNVFLSGPAKLVPGTAMPISIPKADDRKNVIAFLATLKR